MTNRFKHVCMQCFLSQFLLSSVVVGLCVCVYVSIELFFVLFLSIDNF